MTRRNANIFFDPFIMHSHLAMIFRGNYASASKAKFIHNSENVFRQACFHGEEHFQTWSDCHGKMFRSIKYVFVHVESIGINFNSFRYVRLILTLLIAN